MLLDSDLAQLYWYDVKHLNEQGKRNIERFPNDFMFQLVEEEQQWKQKRISVKEKLLLDGQMFDAVEAYIKIYQQARKA